MFPVRYPLHTLICAICLSLPTLAPAGESAVLSCILEPSEDVMVGTPVEGVLVKVKADRSDIVRRGQLLAEMDSALEQAAINTKSAQMAFSSRRLERIQSLQQAQLIPEQEVDEISTEQRLARLEVNERKEQLKLKQIRSPINGVVVERMASRGDLVKGTEVFRIMQLDPLHVELVLALEMFGKVKLGETYDIRLQHLGSEHPAKVTNVDRIVDAASGTFRVRLSLPNPKYKIPPGLRCELAGADAASRP